MFNMAFLTLVNTLFCLAKYALNPHTHPNIRLDILHGHVTMHQACVIQNCIAKMLNGKKTSLLCHECCVGQIFKVSIQQSLSCLAILCNLYFLLRMYVHCVIITIKFTCLDFFLNFVLVVNIVKQP